MTRRKDHPATGSVAEFNRTGPREKNTLPAAAAGPSFVLQRVSHREGNISEKRRKKNPRARETRREKNKNGMYNLKWKTDDGCLSGY